MTVVAQNNSEQRNPEIVSSIECAVDLEDRLKGVPKTAIPIVREFCLKEKHLINEIKELKEERQKLNNQVIALQKEYSKLQEAKSSEYTERKRTYDVNVDLRSRLQDFYGLSVIVSIAFILSDILVDFALTDMSSLTDDESLVFFLGILFRVLGILAVIICVCLSWRSSRNSEKQTNTISQENKPDNWRRFVGQSVFYSIFSTIVKFYRQARQNFYFV